MLKKAMEVFWDWGYGASMQDLVEGMGINRVSIYNEFGSKRGLFLDALDLYCEKLAAAHLHELAISGGGLEALRTFLMASVQALASGGWQRNCLIARAAIEMTADDAEVAQRAEAHLNRVYRAYFAVLDRAVALGELPKGSDIDALTRHMVIVTQGMFITGRAHQDVERLSATINGAISALPAMAQAAA